MAKPEIMVWYETMWERLRASDTVDQGAQVMREWDAARAENVARLAAIKPEVERIVVRGAGKPVPTNYADAESVSRQVGAVVKSSAEINVILEYGARMEFQSILNEANIWWTARVAEFSRQLSVESAKAVQEVAQEVQAVSQDVEVVVDVLQGILRYGGDQIPPAELEAFTARLDNVRARRQSRIASLQKIVDNVQNLVVIADSGILPPLEDGDIPTAPGGGLLSGKKGLVVLAGAGALAFLAFGGKGRR